MRVKLLIAMALASVILLAGALPAGAAIGNIGTGGVVINVPASPVVPITGPAFVQPCISYLAVPAPTVSTGIANTITLGGPAVNAVISLSAPQVPSMSSPSFILSQLSPPSITGFSFTAPIFDP